MPPTERLAFSDAWLGFTRVYGDVLTAAATLRQDGLTDDAAGMLATLASDAASMLRDVGVGASLQEAYLRALTEPMTEAPARLYRDELRLYPLLLGPQKPANASHVDQLENGDTLLDSATTMFPDLPPWIKTTMHGVREVGKLVKSRLSGFTRTPRTP